MNIIEVHRFSSLSSIPSKANVAIAPPISANAIRIQKSTLVRFFVRSSSCELTYVDVSTGSVGGESRRSVGGESRRSVGGESRRLAIRGLSDLVGSAVHFPDTESSGSGSGSKEVSS